MPERAPAGSAPAQHSQERLGLPSGLFGKELGAATAWRGCTGSLRLREPSPPRDPLVQGALPTQGAAQGFTVRRDNPFGNQQLTSWRAGTKTPEGKDAAGGLLNTLHSTRAELSPPPCTTKF